MARKKKEEEMSLVERTADYQVISEEEIDGKLVAVLITHSGAKVTCRIPIRTPEEEKKFGAELAVALTRFAHPEWDLSKCKYMEIIPD